MDKTKWDVSVGGTVGRSAVDRILIVNHDPSRILLEIDVPGLRSIRGEDRRRQGREAIQRAIDALQEVLNSPKALGGLADD